MERIKAYFEEAIKTDPALAQAYDESKLDDCWKFITTQAKKQAKNGCAMIEDSEVFKWARDFMYGDIQGYKDKPAEQKEAETKEAETNTEESKTEKQLKPKMEDGFEVYGEYEEVEDSEEEPTEEKPSEPIIDISKHEDIVSKHFSNPSKNDEKKFCAMCGNFNGNEQYPSGACLLKHKSVLKVEIACDDFTTEKAIFTQSETQPEQTKEKKSKKSNKKEDSYDGPYLFDDLF